jgi:hypothetical protein
MVSLILVALAAICNAVMDKSKFHFHKSIFKNLNPYWWNGEISWKNKYIDRDFLKGFRSIPVQFTDAFHFFKSLMIVLFSLAVICYKPMINPIIDLLMIGGSWNAAFNIFFNKILVNENN